VTAPTVLGGAVDAIKKAYDLARTLQDADKAIATAEIKMRVVDLVDALLNAKFSIAEAQAEVLTLRQQVATLEQEKKVKATVRERGGLYWTEGANGKEDGPYCTACYDTKGQLVRAKDTGNDWIFCPACSHGVDGPNGGPSRRQGGIRHLGIE
jgi:hypothetical protein